MLYIEKTACPEEIAKAIDEKKDSELWRDTIDPANPVLTEKEKHHSIQTLRTHFENLDKKILRPALLRDQHYLCAYCMSQISNSGQTTTIDHWSPLGVKKENAIDYSNFLAVCDGGRNEEKTLGMKKIICCDASKGEQPITIDPRNQDMMNGISYTRDGLVKYQEGTSFDKNKIQDDIDKVLQLNGKEDSRHNGRIDTATRLIQQRRNVYHSTEDICLDLLESGDLSDDWLSKQIDQCLNVESREAFAGVTIFVYQLYRKLLNAKSEKLT